MAKLINQLVCCDCIEGLKMLPDGSIDMMLGSPAFDGLPTGKLDYCKRFGGQNPPYE